MESSLMSYRKIWEKYYDTKIPDGCEIHHIDGNNKNNNIDNLLCVTIEEHLKIHKEQNDWGAVQAILARMDNKRNISEYASLAQKERIKKGTHNFQKISKEERSLISKKTIQERREKNLPTFLGIDNLIENARKGGLQSAKNKAGFLNTDSDNHGSKYTKDTVWWTDKEGNHKRSKHKPEGEWIKGMKWK